MKISIVISTLATNGTLRAWIIAQLLSRRYEVEAIGLLKPGEEIFPWVRDYDWLPVPAAGAGVPGPTGDARTKPPECAWLRRLSPRLRS